MTSTHGQNTTARLYDKDVSTDFYEDRYAHGYMEVAWPVEKRRRIQEVIRGLQLPEAGRALDFGCGDGGLTETLRQALPPGWSVCGTDVSPTAIELARRRFPACTFFAVEDGAAPDRKFDFLFSHHVLEHVYDLPQVLGEMQSYLEPTSAMLHILPCGNPGSFEHQVCLWRTDGIDADLENRFFFEDAGHVRRLTAQQLTSLCAPAGFPLAHACYSNQFFGALNWITQSGPGFMRTFTDVSHARDSHALRQLAKWRYRLWGLWLARFPAALVESRLRKRRRTALDYLCMAGGLPLYLFAKPMDLYLKRKAQDEWETRKADPAGSEMYLCFKRQSLG